MPSDEETYIELPADTEEAEPTESGEKPRRASAVRTVITRGLLVLAAVLVGGEVLLQLPPVRELIRGAAQSALAKRVPGATIARCAAADITGVLRFDGVRVPAGGHLTVVLDGLEIAPRLRSLLTGHLVLESVEAEDVTVRAGGFSWGPAAGSHFSLTVHDPARLRTLHVHRAPAAASDHDTTAPPAPASAHASAAGARRHRPASPTPTPAPPLSPDDLRLTLNGVSAFCRDGRTAPAVAEASGIVADGERHCVSAHTHVEFAVARSAPDTPGAHAVTVARFQALGDRVRVSSEAEPVPLPPLAANGEITRADGKTSLLLDTDVGPHGAVRITASVDEEKARAQIDAQTDAFAELVASLPLPLTQVRELGVDGPVRAQARFEGPLDSIDDWNVDMKLELAKLRAKSHAAGAGALLRSPSFVYHPTADPDAPKTGILMGPKNPDFVPLDALPGHVIEAVLLSEDSEFFTHNGFDAEAIVNAFKDNLHADRIRRGGSTITQQLAKNLWLTRERTFRRKLEEALLTIALEASVPKERILELYLNGIEWGPGIYGLRPAARHYFGKDATELTPKEAAFLGTIIPNPRLYYGYYKRGELTPNWNAHVMAVLAKMRDAEFISEDQYTEADWTVLRFTSTKSDDPWFSDPVTAP